MSEPSTLDTLIVGQGLAGSLLAWTLIQRGEQVLVRDDHQRGSASRVAAGMINPLAGMRFTRPAQVDAWLASARALYRTLEQALERPLLHDLPMIRLLRSPEQRRFYQRQAQNPASAPYLGDDFAPGQSGYALGDPHGGFHQYQTAYLDTQTLLDGLADWLLARDALRVAPVDPSAVRVTAHGVQMGDISARKVIFCEGWRLRDNPWFNWLPLTPAKGEILTLAQNPAQPDRILVAGRWLLPVAGGRCKLGATVCHDPLNTESTEAARTELLTDYHRLLPGAAAPTVLDHQAGVRPNTRDRQPFLGPHPQHAELIIFNGFGGRGSLTIPWHAERLADWMAGSGELPEHADIRRLNPA